MAEYPEGCAASVEGHDPTAVLGGSIYLYPVTLEESPDVWLAEIPANLLRIVTGDDGLHFAMVTSENKAERRDPGTGKDYDAVGEVFFSEDDKRVAYEAGAGGKQFVVIDGQAGKEYDAVGGIAFSSDGKRLAYVTAARGSNASLWMERREGNLTR